MSDTLKSLRREYERLAVAVPKSAPGSDERKRLMEEKRQAFIRWNAAKETQVTEEVKPEPTPEPPKRPPGRFVPRVTARATHATSVVPPVVAVAPIEPQKSE